MCTSTKTQCICIYFLNSYQNRDLIQCLFSFSVSSFECSTVVLERTSLLLLRATLISSAINDDHHADGDQQLVPPPPSEQPCFSVRPEAREERVQPSHATPISAKEVGKVAARPLAPIDWERAATKHGEATSWGGGGGSGGGGGVRTGHCAEVGGRGGGSEHMPLNHMTHLRKRRKQGS